MGHDAENVPSYSVHTHTSVMGKPLRQPPPARGRGGEIALSPYDREWFTKVCLDEHPLINSTVSF